MTITHFMTQTLKLNLFLATLCLTGCMTLEQREYLAAHPNLTPAEINQVKKRAVRAGQSMEMVKAILGPPQRQVAPGYPKDMLLYWTPNETAQSSKYYPTPKDRDEILNQTLSKAVDVAEKAVRDKRGTLRIIYFVNGHVSHEEKRPNVLPEDIDFVRNEGFLSR